MWFALLGPLYIESEGTERPVSAGKQRALLAALAVKANDVVPADLLAQAIWGAHSPPSVQETTRTYIHRLRRRLGPQAAEHIVAQSPGYMLRVQSSELDLLWFESLIREGRACVDVGDWRGALARLSAAEALWRGTLMADIPSRHMHDWHIDYLEQTRLAAAELRIEAQVRMSRHGSAGVIPELRRMTALHPERERLCLLLALAMYRAGRQAEALRVFGEARQFSVTEYGVDPGPELNDLHKRMPAQDPTLLSELLDRFSFE